uniref:Thioredoxin n=1 Tax=Strigamia maritima TaxID=126957 RepID=T1J1M0_STRMM
MNYIKSIDDFRSKLADAGDKLVVIDFSASWCGPCKQIKPKLEEMAKEHQEVLFMYVDVDEFEEISSEYDIKCMPTFVFVKCGKTLEEFAGANEVKLRELVKQYA